MAFTLRGRIETRLAAALAPILVACGLTLGSREWWPLELAGLMLGVGLLLDAAVYHRVFPYQPGWLALPVGALELALVMVLASALAVEAPRQVAIIFFVGTWLLGQLLVHALLPLARLTYAEDGGELGRAGRSLALLILALAAAAGGTAWAALPPTVVLEAGVHRGPLVLDHAQKLVGKPGAVVRGGILITADDVTVRDVTVIGGELGIEVDGARDVLLERVRVAGAALDGINTRRASVTIRDCVVESPGPYAQGIDISFAFDLEPSTVEGCTVSGGQEGIVSHFARVSVRHNTVRSTRLRAITVTEMSAGRVERNDVRDALGVGIYCGDYSSCTIERNSVAGTVPDHASGDRTRMGFAIVAHFGARARLADNVLVGNGGRIASFLHARISSD